MTHFNRLLQAAALTLSLLPAAKAAAQNAVIERGKYLVRLGGCDDCHTPGYFAGTPDPDRVLAGTAWCRLAGSSSAGAMCSGILRW